MNFAGHDVEELLADGRGLLTRGNEIQIFYKGDEAYEAMRRAVEGARVFVHLEMYMFLPDGIGWGIAQVLARAAQSGVKVRVVYDAIGSGGQGGSGATSAKDEGMFEMMKGHGVEVRAFRPVAPWRKRSGILGRNHRKNLIVDGRVAFTGGMNLGEIWSEKWSGEEAWRDTHISLTGPGAAACDHFFRETWVKANGSDSEIAEVGEYRIDGRGEGESDCLVVGGSGFAKRKAIRHLYSTFLRSARRRVILSVPYFAPPGRLLKLLEETEKRGSEVEVLVPQKSDVALADWIREGLYDFLLKKGVSFFEYQESVFHAKTMLVDDEVAVVGSANFDYLSVSWNWELAVVIHDVEIVKQMLAQHGRDLAVSERVEEDWGAAERPWARRLLSWLAARLIRKL